MNGRAYFLVAGAGVLLALAGCGRSFLQGERAAWRHQAEVTCLQSGHVKLGAGVVQIEPIEGPGMCGADFPLKVAALGESSPLVGYADDLRPPGSIPGGSSGQMPRWPVNEGYARGAPVQPVEIEPVQTQPVNAAPGQAPHMRWVPGPPPADRPETMAPAERPYGTAPAQRPYASAPASRPMSISPPGVEPGVTPSAAPLPDDIPDDAVLPNRAAPQSYPRTQPAYNAPVYQQPQQRAVPPLGPMRGPNTTASVGPAVLTPPATLACPIVSALDRWVSEGVQPAALHWFGSPVVTIKQISAYSCRGMVGAGTSHISEHAFGNALDIAGFTLADGRTISVVNGWRGSPEEQGFLHDVQLYACETFTTVLAPGYNAAHYNHIHVDLMRRASGRRPCRPDAIPGEVVAAKARAVYASKQRGPAYTGSIRQLIDNLPVALPGEDGYVADEDTVTGSIAAPAKPDDESVTGSIPAPVYKAQPRSRSAGDETIRAQERRDAFH